MEHLDTVIAIYTRVSSAQQAQEGYSLEAQATTLQTEAEQQGKSVYRVYCDAGISGAVANRPAFQDMIHDAKQGRFSSIWVWNISRLSRNLGVLLDVLEELQKFNVNIYSYSENFDTSTPLGVFGIQFLGSVAQMQRDTIRENTKLGTISRIKKGKACSNIPFGYKSAPDPNDTRCSSKMIVDEDNAAIVKTIYDWYSQGFGISAIRTKLNNAGYKSKKGNLFATNVVYGILRNPVYTGKIKYSGKIYPGIHEAIISDKQWQAVQTKMEAKRYHKQKQSDQAIVNECLLSGLIKCPKCGANMIKTHYKHKNKNGTIRMYCYYVCERYCRFGNKACKHNYVRAHEADTAVTEMLSKYLMSSFWQKQILLKLTKFDSKNSTDSLKHEFDSAKQKCLQDYESGHLSKDEFYKHWQSIKTKYTALLDAEHEQSSSSKVVTAASIKKSFKKLDTILHNSACEEKQKLIRSLVKAVYVDEKRQVTSIEIKIKNFKEIITVQRGEIA